MKDEAARELAREAGAAEFGLVPEATVVEAAKLDGAAVGDSKETSHEGGGPESAELVREGTAEGLATPAWGVTRLGPVIGGGRVGPEEAATVEGENAARKSAAERD